MIVWVIIMLWIQCANQKAGVRNAVLFYKKSKRWFFPNWNNGICVCEVGTVSKISDCQLWGPGFNQARPGQGLNFGRPSFATPSVDRDVKPLVYSLDVLSGDLKEPAHLSGDKRRLMPVLWTVTSFKGTLNLEPRSVVCTVPWYGKSVIKYRVK